MSEYKLSLGHYAAVISGEGAALRVLHHQGRDLVVPSKTGDPNPDYRGIIAAPWPNRLADGKYAFNGELHEVPINEPDRRCALHGLVYDKQWNLDCQDSSSVTLGYTITSQPGYPFTLKLTIEYRLTGAGMHITLVSKNIGTEAAPYGACPHPYLIAGTSPLDKWVLQFKAKRFLEVTPERLLPIEERDLKDDFQFANPRPIGTTVMDHAFTGLDFDGDRWTELTLRDPSGTGVGISWDVHCPWVQLHTADRVPPLANRLGLAVEPMTCPPDAFNNGKDLVTLPPGQEHRLTCRIQAL